MKLKITLARPGSDLVDLSLTAESNTPISEIARELAIADPKARSKTGAPSELHTLRVHETADIAATSGGKLVDHRMSLADSGITSGVIVSIAPASANLIEGRNKDSAAIVKIVQGLGIGKEFNIPLGSTTIGRDISCGIVLEDPLVSKIHARINVTDTIEIIDLGSANGTTVNDQPADRTTLTDADQVSIGDTVITVRALAHSGAALSSGTVYFNRSPRLDPQYVGRKFKAPEIPEKPRPPRLPYLAIAAPLVMGAAIFFLSPGNLFSIAFMALSPVLMIGSYIDNRIQSKKQWKLAKKEFDASIQSLESDIDLAHEEERAGRIAEAPSVASVLQAGNEYNDLLWTRRPEHEAFLSVRLGLGTMPSRHELEVPGQRKGIPEMWKSIESLSTRVAMVESVPVNENIGASGSLGIAGPLVEARSVARGVLAQFAGLHSPAELVVAGLASSASSSNWDWIKWLPHVGSTYSPFSGTNLATGGNAASALVAQAEDLVATRLAESENSKEGAFLPQVLILVEDDTPIDRARLVSLAERGPVVGIHLLWVASARTRLPAACRTYIEIDSSLGAGIAGFVHTGLGVMPTVCESPSLSECLTFAKSLSKVVDAGSRQEDSTDLPSSVSFLQVVGSELSSSSDAVLSRWQETNSILSGPMASSSANRSKPNLRAVFGQAAGEPFALDLRTDGPHALVGGTTGSGKSEFLQAWVLGLASAHSPQRVSFLLVDYKGGSAFAECVNLPHTVGLVTDLSPHLVRRALTSLRAEIRYREHLFQRKRVKDIVEFEKSGDPDVPPSLIIIVDEFAALATEVPEFVDGVVDVAQRGRSLGLNLILATQRPAGVIRDNLRANTNLRVALRMADEADSTDVLGVPLAAGFDPALPGRGAAKTGPGRLRVFQTGYAGGWSGETAESAQVAIEELNFGPGTQWVSPKDPELEAKRKESTSGPTDIQRTVKTIKAASAVAQIPDPRKPWLPELAPAYDFSKLPNKRTDSELVLGVVDDAATQSQPLVSYFPDRDGNMAIFGTGGAGKSTVLRTIAVASAITMRGGPVQIYGLDFGAGGLRMLEVLPHVGSIIDGDDDERVGRLLRNLRNTVDERSVKFAEARAGDIVEYRKIANKPEEARIILLLDGMGAFREKYETSVSSPWFSVFSQIATDGRQVGVHVVVTGDRSASIPTSLSSSIQRRLVLRLANTDDYGMLGVESDILVPTSPPGRGILDGLEVQVAVLGGDSNVAIQSRQIEELATAMSKAGVSNAPSVESLPTYIPFEGIKLTGKSVQIGIADDNLLPVAIDPLGAFVIAGPPGAGRSSAIRTIATSIGISRPEVKKFLLSPRRSNLIGIPGWAAAADSGPELEKVVSQLLKLLEKGGLEPGALAVFLADIADFAGSSVEYDLETLVKSALKQQQFVVAEAETSTWSQAYSIGQPIRAGRKGLLLQPDEGDGDLLLNTSLGRIPRGSLPVGRGFLVAQGRARKIQVAIVEGN